MQVCSVTKNTMMASSQSSLSMKICYKDGLNFTMGIKWYKNAALERLTVPQRITLLIFAFSPDG